MQTTLIPYSYLFVNGPVTHENYHADMIFRSLDVLTTAHAFIVSGKKSCLDRFRRNCLSSLWMDSSSWMVWLAIMSTFSGVTSVIRTQARTYSIFFYITLLSHFKVITIAVSAIVTDEEANAIDQELDFLIVAFCRTVPALGVHGSSPLGMQ